MNSNGKNIKITPQKPWERIPEQMKNVIKSENLRFDVHTHLFNFDYIPPKYFELRLPYIVNTDFLMYVAEELKDNFTDDDEFGRFVSFLSFIKNKTGSEIAEFLISNSPENTIFVALSMDFTGIDCKAKKSFTQQIEELKQIRDKYPDKILPFLAFNPRNSNAIRNFEKAFSENYNFYGIKIYPSLGFLPSHPTLMRLFELCEAYDIPIITHGGNGNIHTTRNLLNLTFLTRNEQNKLVKRKQKKLFLFKNQFVSFFNNPENWEIVLREFPKLRVNFAHLGGINDWDEKENNDRQWLFRILDLMERYPNVYGDISYILHLPKFTEKFTDLFSKNRTFSERTLFGTDFYMVTLEGNYRDIRSKFTNAVGSEVMDKIAKENPLKFLGLR